MVLIKRVRHYWRPFWKGSYTVEAAVVMSILFWIMGALIICSFYMHDKEVLQSVSCEAAVAGSIFARQEERSKAAEKVKNSIQAGRLMGSNGLKASVSAGDGQSSSVWSATCPVPGFAMKYLTRNRLEINKSWESKVIKSTKWIRTIRGVGELLTGGKD